MKHQPGPTFHTQSKAEWLRDQFFPDNPEFPLDAAIVASIPKRLPGKVPSNMTELYADVQLPSQPSRPRKLRRKVDD